MAAPPGWYDDPSGTPTQRWWDGQAWTSSTLDAYQSQMLKLTRSQARSARATGTLSRLVLWTVGAVVGLMVLAALIAAVSVLAA